MTTTDQQQARRTAYIALIKKWWIDPDNEDTSSNEDAGHWLATADDSDPDFNEFGQYAAVTMGIGENGDEIYYVYPEFNAIEDAQKKASDNIMDDLYPERPIEIVDLDTGDIYEPAIRVKWYPKEKA